MSTYAEYSLTDWQRNRLNYNPSAKTSLNAAVTLICKALNVPGRPGLVTANSLDNMNHDELYNNSEHILRSIKRRENIGTVSYIPDSRLIYGEDEYSKGKVYNLDRYVLLTIQGKTCAIFFVEKEVEN